MADKLTAGQAKVVARLIAGPLPSSAFKEAGCSSRKSLHVQVGALRTMGFDISASAPPRINGRRVSSTYTLQPAGRQLLQEDRGV